MRMITYTKIKSKNVRKLARKSDQALRKWKKSNPSKKLLKVYRNIYKGYVTLDIVYKDSDGYTWGKTLFALDFLAA